VNLLKDLKTLLEMRSRFPSIVPVLIPRPLDQVLRTIFFISPLQNLLDVKILVTLNLLGCGSNP
jgi:hypothetical protein